MTMMERPEAVLLDDENNPMLLLLSAGGGHDMERGFDAAGLDDLRPLGRRHVPDDDHAAYWGGAPGNSVEMQSPGAHMLAHALRQSLSPMDMLDGGPDNAAAVPTPAVSHGGSPEHYEVGSGYSGATGATATAVGSDASNDSDRSHDADGDGDDDDGGSDDDGGPAFLRAQRGRPGLPFAPSSAIRIPVAPHMKRKLAFRGTRSWHPLFFCRGETGDGKTRTQKHANANVHSVASPRRASPLRGGRYQIRRQMTGPSSGRWTRARLS